MDAHLRDPTAGLRRHVTDAAFLWLPVDGKDTVPSYARAELDRAMRAFLPGAPLTWMVGLGADAVAGELAAASSERAEELT